MNGEPRARYAQAAILSAIAVGTVALMIVTLGAPAAVIGLFSLAMPLVLLWLSADVEPRVAENPYMAPIAREELAPG
ncbi:MAG: hypothetical protein KF819_18120 [Labilithrix sp.]|nr:hypothetical protein [Labilithrix sp.]